MIFLLVIIAWLGLGLIASGFYLAYFQGKYPGLAERDYASDRWQACLWALMGPASLIVSILGQRGYGWRLR